MNLQEQVQGAVTVLRLQGPLIQEDAEQFLSRLNQVMSKSLGRFVVDAAGIPFVDSQGLEALVDAAEELSKGGRSLKLSGVNETLREVLDLTDLASMFDIYEDVNTAVRSFA